MAKKGRLGSDPLNWIGDSRETEKNKEKKSRTANKEKTKKSANVTTAKKSSGNKKTKADPKKRAAKKQDPQLIHQQRPVKVSNVKQQTVEMKNQAVLDKKQLQAKSIELLSKTRKQKAQPAKTNKKNIEFEGKYLTFVLANEDYGIVITKVKEIIGMLPITRVPRTPDYICGVINLRGKIVSIIDMRLKFGMEQTKETKETVIIVIQTKSGEKGIIVDKVSEVLNISAEDIEPIPEFGASIDTEYILGIGKTDNNVKILLDIGKVVQNNSNIIH